MWLPKQGIIAALAALLTFFNYLNNLIRFEAQFVYVCCVVGINSFAAGEGWGGFWLQLGFPWGRRPFWKRHLLGVHPLDTEREMEWLAKAATLNCIEKCSISAGWIPVILFSGEARNIAAQKVKCGDEAAPPWIRIDLISYKTINKQKECLTRKYKIYFFNWNDPWSAT